jgi:hypothetical protein
MHFDELLGTRLKPRIRNAYARGDCTKRSRVWCPSQVLNQPSKESNPRDWQGRCDRARNRTRQSKAGLPEYPHKVALVGFSHLPGSCNRTACSGRAKTEPVTRGERSKHTHQNIADLEVINEALRIDLTRHRRRERRPLASH